MTITLDWKKPIKLGDMDGDALKLIIEQLEGCAGIYIFGRMFGGNFSPLYVGKATNVKARVKGQFNNHKLMKHLESAKNGARAVIVGYLKSNRNQNEAKAIHTAEAALIKHFIASNFDLHNKQGTKIRSNKIVATGWKPKKAVPSELIAEAR